MKFQPIKPPSPPPARFVRLLVIGLILWLLPTLQPVSASDGSVDDLPQVVIDALEEVVPDLIFTEINIEEEDDGTEYEIHGTWESREVEAKLNELGEFLELEIGDAEDGDDDDELPEPVADALDALFNDPQILSAERIGTGDLEYLEIQIETNNRNQLVKITEAGTLLSVIESVELPDPTEGVAVQVSSLPQAVKDTAGELEIETAIHHTAPESAYFLRGMIGKALITMLVTEIGDLLYFELDRDADGLGDLAEGSAGTSYDQWDTDHDNYPDGFEIAEQTDPLDSAVFPQILTITMNGEEAILEISVRTFRGADFLLEQCGETAGNWQGLGACVMGDGDVMTFVIPIIEEIKRCFFRIRIIPEPAEGNPHGGSGSATGEDCDLPESLVGSEIDVSDDDGETRSLSFVSGSRGEIVEREDGEVEITPFAYSFEEINDCELRVTLTFSTSDGFETEIFTLTFTSETAGAYVSQEYEHGEPEDPEEGDFTLTMN